MLAVGTTGSVDVALDRAAAGLGHAHRDCASSGREVAGSLSSATVEVRLAVVVGLRQVFERLSLGRDLLVGEAELVAGEARPLLGRADHDLAFEIEAGGRRAVEEAAVDA